MTILHNWTDAPPLADTPAKRRIEGRHVAKADRHAHPHEQFVEVVSGRGTLETQEGRQSFSAGSVFHFPAETWHAAVFDEATILVEINVKGERPSTA